MVENHFQRRSADFHPEPKIGRIFLVSLGLHLLVVLIFSGAFTHQGKPPKRPVYYVDLTQLPVASPRAGRPDGQKGTPKVDKKAEKSKPAPVKKATPAKQAVTAAKKTPPPPAKKSTKPSAAKPAKKTAAATKTAKAKPAATAKQSTAATQADYQAALSAVEKLRRKREMEALKQKLAALAASDRTDNAAENSTNAPLGMTDGTGDQAGVSQELWLQERLTKNWSLSKYQVVSRNIEARVRITYNAEGYLTGKQFLKSSGDSTFDDSVTRAILKSRQLEFKPGRTLEVVVIFNLKDLMD